MALQQIETKHGTYEFEVKTFVLGTKIIDMDISKVNLLLMKKCFEKHDLDFGLIYGTLLGAVREKNFIAHDEDTDVFILAEQQDIFKDILFELRELGFELGRYTSEYASLLRDGEYIDIYFYRKKGSKNRECDGYVIKSEVLENLEDYQFLGETFKVPKNPKSLLVSLYGKSWMVVDKSAKASNYGFYLGVREYLKKHYKPLFKIVSWLKKKLVR